MALGDHGLKAGKRGKPGEVDPAGGLICLVDCVLDVEVASLEDAVAVVEFAEDDQRMIFQAFKGFPDLFLVAITHGQTDQFGACHQP